MPSSALLYTKSIIPRARLPITSKLKEENLPSVDYKISATFGSVRVAKTSTSAYNDIFGSTVNRCAKINPFSPRNGLVIGEVFYEHVKRARLVPGRIGTFEQRGL